MASTALPQLKPIIAQGATPELTLDDRTYARALGCVHCGLCLPACPTYLQTGNEADSPRGRIQLMRGLAEGHIQATDSVREHLDLCLDCRACETACPSGVVYHELIEETRTKLPPAKDATAESGLLRALFFHVFTHPTRLKFALLPARLMQRVGLYGLLRRWRLFDLLPAGLRKMEQMLPDHGDLWPRALPERTQPTGTPPAKPLVVGFLPGCVGSVMFDKVNKMAVQLLAHAGCTVVVPQSLGCCGAIHHHNGEWPSAATRAKNNIDAFLPKDGPGVDVIVSTIAGCGAMLHEYDHLLRDDADYATRAAAFSKKVKDVTQLLAEIGVPGMTHRVEGVATYHEACHLLHAQKTSAGPKGLLAKVPGLKMIPLAEADICCGAAGTYNLTQPAMATDLATRKLSHIANTKATTCITGNVGCAMHIQSQARAAGTDLAVKHPVEIIHAAVFGPA